MKDQSVYRKPTEEELRKRLTPEQYQCTQQEGTERPFNNPYWDNKADGIYVDVVSGEALFSSLDKYDSGTGWPSFTRPIEDENLRLREDRKLGVARTEVRSRRADSHLGHVFDDGPGPSGKRYCMNSAALRFVPVDKLNTEGYGRYLFLFTDKKAWDVATLAGGCFWGVEDLLRAIPGVIETEVGYTGGTKKNPRYEDLKTGLTGHAESVRVLFDPKKVSYEKILKEYFRIHDPTTSNRQGNDVGTQYRSAIFYRNEHQKKTAERVKAEVESSGKWENEVVTEIVRATDFWPAEDYHQDYLVKNPGGYTCHYARPFKF